MSAVKGHILVAVQRAGGRLVGPCERMDRTDFRVTLREELPKGHEYAVFFRDASANGDGIQVLARVSSVYHAFDASEGSRTSLDFVDVPPAVLDRLMLMGFKHGIVDQTSLGNAKNPRPVRRSHRSGPLHIPKGQVSRGSVQSSRLVWSLDRLRPNEVPLALKELLDGVLLLPGLHIEPADINKVTLRIASGEGALNVPCEIRYQTEAQAGVQTGVVLGLAPVPTVIRTRLTELADTWQAQPATRTPTGERPGFERSKSLSGLERLRRQGSNTGSLGETRSQGSNTGSLGETRSQRATTGSLGETRSQPNATGSLPPRRTRSQTGGMRLGLRPLPTGAGTPADRKAMPSGAPPAAEPPQAQAETPEPTPRSRQVRIEAPTEDQATPASGVMRRPRPPREPAPPPKQEQPPTDPASLLRAHILRNQTPAAGVNRRRKPKDS
jgi:hypothetical protein